MHTLFIDRRDTRIEVDRDRILVHATHLPRPMSIAFAYLQSIVISAKTTLSSQLLLACARREIPIIVLDSKHAGLHAQYLPPSSGVVARKVQQYQLLQNAQTRLAYAKKLVFAQNLQQIKLLRSWHIQGYLQAHDFELMHTQFFYMQKNVNVAKDLAMLRGCEGALAKLIFQAIGIIAPEWCAFKGRNRRPPQDPINVLLSLTFSMVYAEATRALMAHGLDPMLGFYHDIYHGRYALACDLTELLRPAVEKWVLQLVLNEQLNASHFSSSEQYACTLNKEGRELFYPAWQHSCKAWKKYLRQVAQAWAQQVACDHQTQHFLA